MMTKPFFISIESFDMRNIPYIISTNSRKSVSSNNEGKAAEVHLRFLNQMIIKNRA